MPRRHILFIWATLVLLVLSGCGGGTHNPAYFPWNLKPFGEVVPTHGKPAGLGYYANFDPHAVRVEVRPLEGVSPVQKQYVIIATVYDEHNQPRRSRRVEWMLEGAGNIVEVDESRCLPNSDGKRDNRYGVSFTAFREHLVTRGNNNPNDDFMIRPGQTWCVISSAVEGDSHVTVYCPEIFNWEARKVVVSTRWVDAQWAFPPPAVCRSGTQQVLTTNILRCTDKRPLAGYRVRYRILDGPAAAFLPGPLQEVEAISDLNGNAHANLAQLTPAAGRNRIGIEVIRPPDPTRPSGVGLSLGRGETTVDWQAPMVTLDVGAPLAAPVNQDLSCTITVSNTGQVETRMLTVRQVIPEGVQYVRSDPPANLEGNRLVWTLGELPPGQKRTLQSVLHVSRLGTIAHQVSVVTAEGLHGEKTATTEVTPQPQARLKVSIGVPASAILDSQVVFPITVSNPGSAPAAKVVLSADLDAGLEHVSRANPVETAIGTLAPGESRQTGLTVTARKTGQQGLRLTATADGGLKDAAQQAVTVQRAVLKLDIKGPAWGYVTRSVEWSLNLANAGDVVLNSVMLRATLPAELSFKSAGDGGVLEGNQVVWNVNKLQAGDQKILRLTTLCQQLSPRAQILATAHSEGGIQVQGEAAIEIRGLPAVRLRVVDRDDPIEVGGKTEYRIEVANQGSLPGHDLEITALVPEEMRILDSKGPSTVRVEGQQVRFAPLENLAPGQTVTYTIAVEALKAGTVYFRADLKARTLSSPVVEEESTVILAGVPSRGGTP